MAGDTAEGVVSANTPEQQEARAFLRERFLRCISSLTGNNCKMKTIENNEISGIFQGMDIHVQSMFIKNLKTPFTEMKHSLIRTSDVFSIHFPEIKKEKVSEESS